MSKQKSLVSVIRQEVSKVDSVGRNRAGNVVVRYGYFYRNGLEANAFAQHIEDQLIELGRDVRVVAFGDHWAPFKGGASVAKQSHFWVELAEA